MKKAGDSEYICCIFVICQPENSLCVPPFSILSFLQPISIAHSDVRSYFPMCTVFSDDLMSSCYLFIYFFPHFAKFFQFCFRGGGGEHSVICVED